MQWTCSPPQHHPPACISLGCGSPTRTLLCAGSFQVNNSWHFDKGLRTRVESKDCQPRHAQHLAREFASCLAAPAVSQQSPAHLLDAPQVMPGPEGRSSSKVSLFSNAAASPAARPHAAHSKLKLSL